MKKTIIFFLLLLGFNITKAQIPVLTYERMEAGYVDKWLEERLANIKKNLRETVEMPMVVRSTGWGCRCPMHYIGVGTTVQEGPWIAPVYPDDFMEIPEEGMSFIVTGYFTGKWITEDLRGGDPDHTEWLYKKPEFIITSWKLNDLDYSANAPRVLKTEKVTASKKGKTKN